MEKVKIHYTKDGWLCNRYPYDLPIEDESRYIEVSTDEWENTLGCDKYHSWRVVKGKLCHERYEATPEAELLQELRERRDEVCFPVINRGRAWYDMLTDKQRQELDKWYKDWLDVTKTKKEPRTPAWFFSSKKEGDKNGANQNSAAEQQAARADDEQPTQVDRRRKPKHKDQG